MSIWDSPGGQSERSYYILLSSNSNKKGDQKTKTYIQDQVDM